MSGLQELKLKTEKIKVLKVVGEEVAQVVVEGHTPIDAVKIVKIDAALKHAEDEIFKDKVVKQGVIHKQIFYVDPEDFVRHISEEIPFMVTVDISGVRPGPFTEVQNHLLDISTDFHLEPVSGCGIEDCFKDDREHHHKRAVLKQKIVARILVKVTEWTQMDVVTNVQLFPRMFNHCKTKTFRCC